MDQPAPSHPIVETLIGILFYGESAAILGMGIWLVGMVLRDLIRYLPRRRDSAPSDSSPSPRC